MFTHGHSCGLSGIQQLVIPEPTLTCWPHRASAERGINRLQPWDFIPKEQEKPSRCKQSINDILMARIRISHTPPVCQGREILMEHGQPHCRNPHGVQATTSNSKWDLVINHPFFQDWKISQANAGVFSPPCFSFPQWLLNKTVLETQSRLFLYHKSFFPQSIQFLTSICKTAKKHWRKKIGRNTEGSGEGLI